jgi:hypothetical protein
MDTTLLNTISPGFKALAAQYAAAGLNVETMIAAGPDALRAHIATASADTIGKAVADTVKTCQASLDSALAEKAASDAKATAATTSASAATTRHATVAAALATAGITVAPEATLDQMTKAIEDRISTRAGEELAKHGVGTAFVNNTPSADPASGARLKNTSLTGLARVQASLEAATD